MSILLDTRYTSDFIKKSEWDAMQSRVTEAHNTLHNHTGLGSDMLGWLDLPTTYDRDELDKVCTVAQKIQEDSDALIVVGIGGSYLGTRAAIELLKTNFYNSTNKTTPDIHFVGNSMSAFDLEQTMRLCQGKRISINVISKSGTTLESAMAFRMMRQFLIDEVGEEEARKRIYVTTDRTQGVLKALADKEGYETFIIPANVGGRYSVLTAVGMLPVAVAGCDIFSILKGAANAAFELQDPDIYANPCYRYAAGRHILMNKGRSVEVLVNSEPRFTQFGEWWRQLFAESEGKNGKGLFPISSIFTSELHSVGQFIQQGSPILFETAVMYKAPANDLRMTSLEGNFDKLNYLDGKSFHNINNTALISALMAHADGGTPSMLITVPAADEENLGYLFYFFEKACAISSYMLGVNPFDQPGVEGYKYNVFALLGRPGFEARLRELKRILQ